MENVLEKNRQENQLDRQSSNGITAICLAIFTAVVYQWLITNPDSTPVSRLFALINAALFAALGIRFVPLWVAAWQRTAKVDKGKTAKITKTESRVLLKIFLSFLLIDVLIILFVYLLQIISGKTAPFHEALELWKATDSGHYLAIAQDWYLSTGHWDRLVQLVFLPGYPLLIRLVNSVVGNALYSGLIVSGLCFAGAGTMLYRLVRLDHSHNYAIRTLKYLCILPAAFFFASPMSESLFLLLSISSIYFLRKKDWLFACIFAGLAAFTRSLGLVLMVPILFEMIAHDIAIAHDISIANDDFRSLEREGSPGIETNNAMEATPETETKLTTKTKSVFRGMGRKAPKYFNLLLVLFGFGCYLFINYQVAGNPFQFLIYQKEHWNQSIGLFFNTVSYQTAYAANTFQAQNYRDFMGLWLPNLLSIFFSLIVILIGVKKLRPSATAYFIAYYVVAIGATWLLSAPRYLLTMFPIPIVLAAFAKKRWVDHVLTIVLTVLFVLYAYMFVNRWQVW